LVLTACSEGGSSRRHDSSSDDSHSSHDGDDGVREDGVDDQPDGGPSEPHQPSDQTIAAILPDLAALEGTPYGELEEDPVAENGDDASACEAFSRACEALRAYGEVLYAGSSSE